MKNTPILQVNWIDRNGGLTAKQEHGYSMPLYSAADVDALLGRCFTLIVSIHPHSTLLRKQLSSGELARRLVSIGPAFDPTGRVKLLLDLQSILTQGRVS